MKHQRPLFVLVAAIAACSWSVSAFACDQEKGTKATAASMGKGANASCAASTRSGAKGTTAATTASMEGCCAKNGASATSASVAGHSDKNSMSGGSCAMHGAKATAVTASATHGCSGAEGATSAGSSCAMHGTSATAAGSSCSAHGTKATAVTASATHGCSGAEGATAAGSSCPAHANSATAANARHAGCTFCEELNGCDQEMRSLGAVAQVVPLKNGVMFVYTSDPARVRAIQSAMARRKDQAAVFASTDSGDHLCNDCKAMRGAAASGKLTREVVNIDSGCLTLMTSSDPAVVARIHELAGVPTNRIKS